MEATQLLLLRRDHILPLALTGAATYLTYRVAKTFWKRFGIVGPHHRPKPTRGGNFPSLDFLGILLQHALDIRKGDFGEAFMRWTRESYKKGMNGVVAFYFGTGRPRVMISHPDDVAHVVNANYTASSASPMAYVKGKEPYQRLEFLLGKSSLVTIRDEAFHSQQRRAVSSAFSPMALQDIANSITREVMSQMVNGIGEELSSSSSFSLTTTKTKGEMEWVKDVNLEHFYLRATQDVMTWSAFKTTDVGDIANHMNKIGERQPEILEILFPFLRYVPTPTKLNFLKSIKGMKKHSLQLMRQVEKENKEEEGEAKEEVNNTKKKTRKTSVDLLLAMPELDTKMLQDHAITFLFAGHETTSRALTWTTYLLSLHPEVQETLFEEVSSAFALDAVPTLDDLKGCKYLENVIKESLRYLPPVPIVARMAAHDDVMPGSGVFIAKDTVVMVCPFVLHRSVEAYGDDANEFKPERWDDPALLEKESKVFMPFLQGKRNCIGKDFAMHELLLGVAMLVRKFQVRWPEGRAHPRRVQTITMKPSPASRFDVRQRSK